MKSISAREFNQQSSRAKRAADSEIVFITDRGRASHVLMSIAAYDELCAPRTLYSVFADGPASDIEFEPPRARLDARPVDLS